MVRACQNPEVIAKIKKNEQAQAEERIIGIWFNPLFPGQYFDGCALEFNSNHTITSCEEMMSELGSGATWSIEKNVLKISSSRKGKIEIGRLMPEGDKVVSDRNPDQTLVKVEQEYEDDAANSTTVSRVVEGLNLASVVKIVIENNLGGLGFETLLQSNDPDPNRTYNMTLNLPPENEITNKYVSGIAVMNSGVIRITYNDNLGKPSANGKTILLTPGANNDKKHDWDCSGGTMPVEYRPQSCR